MFGIYAEAKARGQWLKKHPAYPSLSPVTESGHYRCSEEGCGRSVVRSNSAQSGWAHLPRARRKAVKKAPQPVSLATAWTDANGAPLPHRFRPTPGNAVFCADCPPGDSVAEKGTHRHVGEPFPLEVAVEAFRGIPDHVLYAELKRRNLTHGTHMALRSYDNPGKCFTCGEDVDTFSRMP